MRIALVNTLRPRATDTPCAERNRFQVSHDASGVDRVERVGRETGKDPFDLVAQGAVETSKARRNRRRARQPQQRRPPYRSHTFEDRRTLLHELPDALLDRLRPVDRNREAREALPLALRDLGPQRLDVDEVVVHRTRRQTGPLGDLLHARQQDPLVVTRHEGFDDRFPVSDSAPDPAVHDCHAAHQTLVAV